MSRSFGFVSRPQALFGDVLDIDTDLFAESEQAWFPSAIQLERINPIHAVGFVRQLFKIEVDIIDDAELGISTRQVSVVRMQGQQGRKAVNSLLLPAEDFVEKEA